MRGQFTDRMIVAESAGRAAREAGVPRDQNPYKQRMLRESWDVAWRLRDAALSSISERAETRAARYVRDDGSER